MDKSTPPSKKNWLGKLARVARSAGSTTVYSALLMYYAYERKDTPGWAKRTILGALGYVLLPFDAIPDLTPVLGYTDDLAVLSAGLATVAVYVNKEVKQKARTKLDGWLPAADPEELDRLDRTLAP